MTLDRPTEFEGLPAEFSAALLAAATTIDSSDDAIVSYRLDGTIISWSPTAERLYGWTVAEAIGQNIEMIVPEARLEELSAIAAPTRPGRGYRSPRDDANPQGRLQGADIADDLSGSGLRRAGRRGLLHRSRRHR